jgi:predicted anti-sigma-YlaC factor YlaD
MRCKRVRNKLSGFLDNQASERIGKAVSHHLETCQSCREEAEALASLSALLREEKDNIKITPCFWTKLEQRMIQAEANRTVLDMIFEGVNRTLLPAGATVVIVIGLFVGARLGGTVYTRINQILNPDNSSLVLQEINQSLNLNILDDFPQESMGDIYNGLLAENNLPKQKQ